MFYLGSVSKDFTKDELSKISLNGTIYDFSIDHSSIGKQYIFNIHGHLIKSIKWYKKCFNLLNTLLLYNWVLLDH